MPHRQEDAKEAALPPPAGTALLLHTSSQHHVGGDKLDRFLELLRSALKREIGEATNSTSRKEFMRKCKVYFCLGVNDVTRILERMPCAYTSSMFKVETNKCVQGKARTGLNSTCASIDAKEKSKIVTRTSCLQVVLVATDVHPRHLVGHLPGLAASRQVPLIFISGGNGTGSLRLGEIFKLRTAIAVGLKVGDSELSRMIRSFLKDDRGSGLAPS